MGNSWKYAQVLRVPRSDLCECGHYRKDHLRKNNVKSGFCYLCPDPNKPIEMGQSPSDDVFDFIVGKREKCEKIHKWSVERVRAFWQIVNISLRIKTNTEQTLLDDYYPISNIHECYQ